jgi:hypothetical protein
MLYAENPKYGRVFQFQILKNNRYRGCAGASLSHNCVHIYERRVVTIVISRE